MQLWHTTKTLSNYRSPSCKTDDLLVRCLPLRYVSPRGHSNNMHGGSTCLQCVRTRADLGSFSGFGVFKPFKACQWKTTTFLNSPLKLQASHKQDQCGGNASEVGRCRGVVCCRDGGGSGRTDGKWQRGDAVRKGCHPFNDSLPCVMAE